MKVSHLVLILAVGLFSILFGEISVQGQHRSLPTSKPDHKGHQPLTSLPSTTSSQVSSPRGGHHPPIDCPLHKQGIHVHKLRPFDDVQKYIQMLEKPNRVLWQKPDAVVKALHLKGHEVVADLGAGSGYFTFRFAKQLPRGKVFAIDIEPEMLRHIHHNTMLQGIRNIHVILSKPDDPKVPPGVDVVFICDVLHHVEKRALWLQRLFRSLPSQAKVVVIEFKQGKLPQGPPESIKIPKSQLVALFRQAGFLYMTEQPNLLPYQEFLVFQKR